jgi:patatin-like phospholipase/acyl hydrolase
MISSPSNQTPSDGVQSGRFQVLALSGGGFRGLYTAKIVADLEEAIGAPFASRFDLIAGTSVGGILGLALAMEIPASRIVRLFIDHGRQIFQKRFSLGGLIRAPYSAQALQELLGASDLFGQHVLGACKHPVIVPAINYTTGQATLFKTPHHPDLSVDHRAPLVDIALATSAAPSYFPRHVYAHCQYVDGGLFANAPGSLALHEATEYFGREVESVHILSIGTMSSRFTVDPRRSADGGALDWGGGNPLKMPRRLFNLSISVQEVLSCHMLARRLSDRYVHVDDPLADERSRAVALDKTDTAAQQVLLGVAGERSKVCKADPKIKPFLEHSSSKPVFYHGEHKGSPC